MVLFNTEVLGHCHGLGRGGMSISFLRSQPRGCISQYLQPQTELNPSVVCREKSAVGPRFARCWRSVGSELHNLNTRFTKFVSSLFASFSLHRFPKSVT